VSDVREIASANHNPAVFWAVDLHVHTPASQDVQEQAEKYGGATPEDIVKAARDAGLDAIAITDHNTVNWCDRVAQAAVGHNLIVLPGVEISTRDGHLLGIWEEGTRIEAIEDLLVRVGINRADHGKLDVAASVGIAEAARMIVDSGGLAIAAHVDREKGLLQLSVRSYLKRILLDPALAAVEVVSPDVVTKIESYLKGQREIACVRSSDVTVPGQSWHALAGIGRRRTWIKASRPDLRGLRHALEDPSLRVRLDEPPKPQHPVIHSVSVTGGFLADHTFNFSSDLNCLLGGTGAGKSLLIEIIRFVLNQQASERDFPSVRREVDSRLSKALGMNSTVELTVQRGDARFTVRRAYCGPESPAPEVVNATNAEVLEQGIIPIRAFSQGEVIEFARTPVGRMALIDAALDLTDIEAKENETIAALTRNAEEVTELRAEIGSIKENLEALPEISRQLDELTKFFDGEVVKQQEKWSREKARFGKLDDSADLKDMPTIKKPRGFEYAVENESNEDLYKRASAAYAALNAAIDRVNAMISEAYRTAKAELSVIATEWRNRSKQFDLRFSEELAKIDSEGKGLAALKKRLIELQTTKTTLDDAAVRMSEQLIPTLTRTLAERDSLLDRLVAVRRERRNRRRRRIGELNRLMRGVVRIKLLEEADDTAYHRELSVLAKGARLRSDFLQELCSRSSPLKLVKSYLASDSEGVADAIGVEAKHVEKLFDWIAEHQRDREMLALQAIDLPDALSIEFRKPGSTEYEPIEQLAHGQKCTAILIVAMADGDEPLIIDQPEDALHAPWIEEYLVKQLRHLRGSRQYIFATRSPGLVVSADAEMIITLTSDATRGRVEASGSLERHDLNALALYHLEGGAQPFLRRTKKLAPSMA